MRIVCSDDGPANNEIVGTRPQGANTEVIALPQNGFAGRRKKKRTAA
jgi:hypothetical protein